MQPASLLLHPIYGAIYKNGEFVQRGAVLGLSPDGGQVVVAPISGWIRVPLTPALPDSDAPALEVQIEPHQENASDTAL